MSDLISRPPADHSVKIPHLVFGLLFLGAAGIWALVVTDVITEDRLPVLAPAVLIVAGVIGLAVSLASTRNRRQKLARQLPEPDHLEVDDPADHQPEPEPGLDSGLDSGFDSGIVPGLDSDIDETREIR